MNDEEYIDKRLVEQASWYDRNASKNQKAYKFCKVLEFGSAAIIPFLAGNIDKIPYSAWMIGALGIIVAFSSAVSSLNKYQENWLKYRQTAESLNKEKFLYATKAAPYTDELAFAKLVRRVEKILTDENNQWVDAMLQEQDITANEHTNPASDFSPAKKTESEISSIAMIDKEANKG